MKKNLHKSIRYLLVLFYIMISGTASAIGWEVVPSNIGKPAVYDVTKYLVVPIIQQSNSYLSPGMIGNCTATFLSKKVLLTARHCLEDDNSGSNEYLFLYRDRTPYTLRFANAYPYSTFGTNTYGPNVFLGESESAAGTYLYEKIDLKQSSRFIYLSEHTDAALIILNSTPLFFSSISRDDPLNNRFPRVLNAMEEILYYSSMEHDEENRPRQIYAKVFGVGYGFRHQDYNERIPEGIRMVRKIGMNRMTTEPGDNPNNISTAVRWHDLNYSTIYKGRELNQLITYSFDFSNADNGDSGGPLLIYRFGSGDYINGAYDILGVLYGNGNPKSYIYRSGKKLLIEAYTYFTQQDIRSIQQYIADNP